jgi:hypothetical protein
MMVPTVWPVRLAVGLGGAAWYTVAAGASFRSGRRHPLINS